MTAEEINLQIRELESVRRQERAWRLGSTLAIVLITVFCVGALVNSVHGLFEPGPKQNQFATALTADMRQDVLPQVQTLASQTLTQSQPEIQEGFTKLNARVPELTSLSMQQLDMLQKDLPATGERVLNASYGTMLQNEEPKIRQMFPDATDDNVKALVDTMTTEGQKQIVGANDTLFSQHMNALNAIVGDLTTIQNTETVNPQQDQANWEMALQVVDSFHDDLQNLKTEGATSDAPQKNAKEAKK